MKVRLFGFILVEDFLVRFVWAPKIIEAKSIINIFGDIF